MLYADQLCENFSYKHLGHVPIFAEREMESQGSSIMGDTDTKERWLLFVVLFLLRGLSVRFQVGLPQGFLLQPLFSGAEMAGMRDSAGYKVSVCSGSPLPD